ncbi:chitinase [Goodfellowiella coeruleoviolacea]|uniref:Chitinase n=1 Tax=Goodfellowiella coeruleoviolacea TaxID=334858 RepID=A0AAE3KJG8_9PSEU|nr:chitinase [Goodfellowiella coeruleoviolacea]MCP2164288.1 chitinase [Goodfellowiella coeruleoviolacea]
MRTSPTRVAATALLLAGFLSTAGTATAADTPPATAPATPVAAAPMTAAPYYMPLDNNPQDVADILANSGVKHLILAFVLAPNTGGCTPTWDGNPAQPVRTDTAVAATIAAIRAAGGDVSVSFGGYNGVELGAACSDATSLANAYQQVVDKYSLRYIDLDIEGDDLGDVAGETRRFQAVRTLKQRNPGLHVSLTLPVTTIGLSDLGKSEITRAKNTGTDIDLFKVMLFDYGGPAGNQANDVIRIAELVHGQLRQLHPEYDDATAYARTGAILMNGHTDQPSELFTQATFTAVRDYLRAHHLGRFSFWSLNRDRACTGQVGWVDGRCSSVSQQPYEFAKIIAQYQG